MNWFRKWKMLAPSRQGHLRDIEDLCTCGGPGTHGGYMLKPGGDCSGPTARGAYMSKHVDGRSHCCRCWLACLNSRIHEFIESAVHDSEFMN